ncbi:MAG: hypothetical protein H6819_09170 [Phycisphaerales bacterium]|nr:hypothetical protein [Phycisphaerales bacterium]MCB9856002.1 hypothetical protein [Phycisphaerales bacterium]MCB9864971.1 hypothetical protein [Phycisphaerales bacterium]
MEIERDQASSPEHSVGTVGEATRCARCDYDVRGLDPRGCCPEYGLPIEITRARGVLAILEPHFFWLLSVGARMSSILVRGLFIAFVVAFFVALSWESMATPALIVGVASLFLIAMQGVWLTTQPPMLRLFSDRIRMARQVAHWSAAAVMVGTLVSALLMFVSRSSNFAIMSMIVMATPLGLIGAIGGVAFGIYFCQLASAFSDVALRRKVGRQTWAFVVSCAMTAAGYFGPIVTRRFPSPSSVLTIGVICQLVTGARILLLPGALLDRLTALRETSESEWRRFDVDLDSA